MSCKKSTELIEKSKINTLSLKEKVFLRLHLAMCSPCSKYNILSDQLDSLIQKGLEKEGSIETISDKRKQEILKLVYEI